MPPTRLMLADDHEIVRAGLRMLLGAQTDMEIVAEASSGAQAIELAQTHQPDVVLMDIGLKGIGDGVSVAQRIQTRLDIPVIYLTGLSDNETVKRAFYSRPYGYITKPFREEELHNAIRNALSRHRMKREMGG